MFSRRLLLLTGISKHHYILIQGMDSDGSFICQECHSLSPQLPLNTIGKTREKVAAKYSQHTFR